MSLSCTVSEILSVAAQRKIKWLGTGAEIEAPKALRSETPKASRGVGKKRFILLFRRDIRPLVAIFVCNSFPSHE